VQSNDRPPSESHASDTAPTVRMVIRARIEPEPIPEVPQEEWNIKAIVLAAAAFVALLIAGWFGIRALMKDDGAASKDPSIAPHTERFATPPSTADVTSEPQDARGEQIESPDISPPTPRIDASAAVPRDDTPEAVTQVRPEVSQNALNTIRGTVRVAIEVTIDRNGNVMATRAAVPGPSRYFERASHAAAEKWQFTPSNSDVPRTMLLRFHYTRGGVEILTEP
jgi:TonB family protein